MSKRSGSEKRIMTESITVRVDPDLYDRIRCAAKREGMSAASWLRIIAAAAAGDEVKAMPRKPTPQPKPKVFRPSIDAPALAPFLNDLGRIGNNINQISLQLYRASQSNIGYKETLDKLISAHEELKGLLQNVHDMILAKEIRRCSDDN